VKTAEAAATETTKTTAVKPSEAPVEAAEAASEAAEAAAEGAGAFGPNHNAGHHCNSR
jgi:hypothetical protein